MAQVGKVEDVGSGDGKRRSLLSVKVTGVTLSTNATGRCGGFCRPSMSPLTSLCLRATRSVMYVFHEFFLALRVSNLLIHFGLRLQRELEDGR